MMKTFIIILLTIQAAISFDFGKYTVIDEETKNFLRTNREKIHPDSTINPGVLYVFGNSITIENEFWSIIPESDLGAVPGTIDSTYSSDYKCADYGNTLWDADHCFKSAVEKVRPEAIIIMFGTNESSNAPSNQVWDEWIQHYGSRIDDLLSVGIIPIVSTIPPLSEVFDSSDIPVDSVTPGINKALRSMAKSKHIVLVDYHQALVDYTRGKPFDTTWYSDFFVHPSWGCEPDTSEPTCGYGIRNAVCWQAVNKVYRIIVDNGPPDTGMTYTVSTENARKAPRYLDNTLFATSIPGSSNIKLSFRQHEKPQVIRLLTLNGTQVKIHITMNTADALLSVKNVAHGLYFIEAYIKNQIHRTSVLLIP